MKRSTYGLVFVVPGLVLAGLGMTQTIQERQANAESVAAAEQVTEELQSVWQSEPTVSERDVVEQDPVVENLKLGKPFALLYIPRLRDKVWALPLLEGVRKHELNNGAGHYPSTQLPGDIGNFAVAAHRATHGEPFANFDLLRAGDKVYVETETLIFRYVLQKDKIVNPDDVWVIAPVPGKSIEPTRQLITLTTCSPRWASTNRWVWWGELEKQYNKSSGRQPKWVGQIVN